MTSNFRLSVFAAAVMGLCGPAQAVDVRQIIVQERTGVAVEPVHEAHVLTEPNRDFDLKQKSAQWLVFEPAKQVVLLPEEEAALRRAEEEELARQQAEIARLEALKHPKVQVYFDFNRTTPVTTKVDLSPVLEKGKPSSSVVKVTGHADEVGSDSYNLHLSQRRAQGVAIALTKAGIPKANMIVKGVGKREPIDTSDAAKNRVVEIHVVRTEGDQE